MKTFKIKINTIEETVNEMIEKSEDLYGFISLKLPVLEKQADIAIEKSKGLLRKFDNENNQQGESFLSLVNNLDQEMNKIYHELNSRKEISTMLEKITDASSNEDEININSLLDIIDDLSSVFASLEQLSINAIIFSSRLERGEAFRVISQEINKLSKDVEAEYDKFKISITNLKQWNIDFIDHLERISKIEGEIFKQYNSTLKKAIESIIASLEGITMLIKDFIHQIEISLEPISNIMIELQGQDLIRQNMENLNEIIQSVGESIIRVQDQDMDIEQRLNTLQFIIDISELSKNLMGNINHQLEDSVEAILNEVYQMDNLLEVITEDGKNLWDYMVNGIESSSTETSSIDQTNALIIHEVADFKGKLERIIQNYNEIDDSDEILSKHLDHLRRDFGNIDQISNQFNRVRMLAKIEYARLNLSNNAHIKNIEKVIDLFIQFTNKNENILNEIEKTILEDLNHFSDLRENIIRDLSHASSKMTSSENELRTVKKAVKDTISELDDITTSLYDNVNFIIHEFQEFSDISSNVESIYEVLDQVIFEAEEIKKASLKEADIDEWNTTNDYFESIEEKFTSYIERKTAQDVFDSDVDIGSEGGELTLF